MPVAIVAPIAGILYAYELFDLWSSPWWTAWLIVAIFLSGVLAVAESVDRRLLLIIVIVLVVLLLMGRI